MTTSEAQSREATSMLKSVLLGIAAVIIVFGCIVALVVAVIFAVGQTATGEPSGLPSPHTILEGGNPYDQDSSQK